MHRKRVKARREREKNPQKENEKIMEMLKEATFQELVFNFIFSSILLIIIFVLSGWVYWNKPEWVLKIGLVDFFLFFIHNALSVYWRFYLMDLKEIKESIDYDEKQREEIRILSEQLEKTKSELLATQNKLREKEKSTII